MVPFWSSLSQISESAELFSSDLRSSLSTKTNAQRISTNAKHERELLQDKGFLKGKGKNSTKTPL